eukprot:1873146-Amphidinium_carterae.1
MAWLSTPSCSIRLHSGRFMVMSMTSSNSVHVKRVGFCTKRPTKRRSSHFDLPVVEVRCGLIAKLM